MSHGASATGNPAHTTIWVGRLPSHETGAWFKIEQWLGILVALCIWCISSFTWAESTSSPHIVITLVGQIRDATTLRQRIESWHPNKDIRFQEAPSLHDRALTSAQETDVIHVWIAIAAPDEVHVYFARTEGSEERYLLRQLELRDGLDEVGLEEIAQVVHASSIAFVEGTAETPQADVKEQMVRLKTSEDTRTTAHPPRAEVAENQGQAQAPDDQPSASTAASAASAPVADTSPPENPWRWCAGPAYALDNRGGEGWAHGPELAVAMHHRLGLGLSARGHYWLPNTRGPRRLKLEFSGITLRAGPSFTRSLGAWGAGAQLLAGFDWVGVSASSDASELMALEPVRQRRPVVEAAAIAWRSVDQHWGVHAAARISWQLWATHYDVIDGGAQTTALDAGIWQPGLSIGVQWQNF